MNKGKGSSSARQGKRKPPQNHTRKDPLTSEEIVFLANRIRDSFEQVVIKLELEYCDIDEVKDDNNNQSKKWKPAVLRLALNKLGKDRPRILALLKKAHIDTNNKITWDEFKEEFNIDECLSKRYKSSEPTIGPNKCVVAGVENKFKGSPLVSIKQPYYCEQEIRLGVVAKSALMRYDQNEDDVRMTCLLHDGQTIMKAVAFGESAKLWQNILQENVEYGFNNFKIRRTDERYECTDFQIILHQDTVYEHFLVKELNIPTEKKYKLADVKDEALEKMLISTDAVIICDIGTCFQPKQKILREIYVMDTEGTRMKVNFWSDNDDDFEYNFKDTIELKYFRLDQFNEEYYLELNDVSNVIKSAADPQLFEPFLTNGSLRLQIVNMSLDEIKALDESHDNVIVNEAEIKRFKFDDGSLIYQQCGVKNHGELKPLPNGKFYCKRCRNYCKYPKDVVKLVASIDDGSSQAWVMMYNQTAEVLLGEDFDAFMEKDTRRWERSEILDKIKKKKRNYKFGLKVICRNDESGEKEQRIIVRNVSKLH